MKPTMDSLSHAKVTSIMCGSNTIWMITVFFLTLPLNVGGLRALLRQVEDPSAEPKNPNIISETHNILLQESTDRIFRKLFQTIDSGQLSSISEEDLADEKLADEFYDLTREPEATDMDRILTDRFARDRDRAKLFHYFSDGWGSHGRVFQKIEYSPFDNKPRVIFQEDERFEEQVLARIDIFSFSPSEYDRESQTTLQQFGLNDMLTLPFKSEGRQIGLDRFGEKYSEIGEDIQREMFYYLAYLAVRESAITDAKIMKALLNRNKNAREGRALTEKPLKELPLMTDRSLRERLKKNLDSFTMFTEYGVTPTPRGIPLKLEDTSVRDRMRIIQDTEIPPQGIEGSRNEMSKRATRIPSVNDFIELYNTKTYIKTAEAAAELENRVNIANVAYTVAAALDSCSRSKRAVPVRFCSLSKKEKAGGWGVLDEEGASRSGEKVIRLQSGATGKIVEVGMKNGDQMAPLSALEQSFMRRNLKVASRKLLESGESFNKVMAFVGVVSAAKSFDDNDTTTGSIALYQSLGQIHSMIPEGSMNFIVKFARPLLRGVQRFTDSIVKRIGKMMGVGEERMYKAANSILGFGARIIPCFGIAFDGYFVIQDADRLKLKDGVPKGLKEWNRLMDLMIGAVHGAEIAEPESIFVLGPLEVLLAFLRIFPEPIYMDTKWRVEHCTVKKFACGIVGFFEGLVDPFAGGFFSDQNQLIDMENKSKTILEPFRHIANYAVIQGNCETERSRIDFTSGTGSPAGGNIRFQLFDDGQYSLEAEIPTYGKENTLKVARGKCKKLQDIVLGIGRTFKTEYKTAHADLFGFIPIGQGKDLHEPKNWPVFKLSREYPYKKAIVIDQHDSHYPGYILIDESDESMNSVQGIQGSQNAENILYGTENSIVISGGQRDDFLVGGPKGEEISGWRGDDVIRGAEGADILKGGKGNDSLFGGPGDDILYGGQGSDSLDGGPGSDTVIFEGGVVLNKSGAFPTGVIISLKHKETKYVVEELLALEYFRDLEGKNGDAYGDNLINVERIIGTVMGDVLEDDNNQNSLDGGAGDDILISHGGVDLLHGGAGKDIYDLRNATGVKTIVQYDYYTKLEHDSMLITPHTRLDNSRINNYIMCSYQYIKDLGVLWHRDLLTIIKNFRASTDHQHLVAKIAGTNHNMKRVRPMVRYKKKIRIYLSESFSNQYSTQLSVHCKNCDNLKKLHVFYSYDGLKPESQTVKIAKARDSDGASALVTVNLKPGIRYGVFAAAVVCGHLLERSRVDFFASIPGPVKTFKFMRFLPFSRDIRNAWVAINDRTTIVESRLLKLSWAPREHHETSRHYGYEIEIHTKVPTKAIDRQTIKVIRNQFVIRFVYPRTEITARVRAASYGNAGEWAGPLKITVTNSYKMDQKRRDIQYHCKSPFDADYHKPNEFHSKKTMDENDVFLNGQSIAVKCRSHSLALFRKATCVRGMWRPPIKACDQFCPKMRFPTSARVKKISTENEGSQVKVRCIDPKEYLIGPSEFYCKNGEWSPHHQKLMCSSTKGKA